jgi:hypothetical protein
MNAVTAAVGERFGSGWVKKIRKFANNAHGLLDAVEQDRA